MNIKQFANVDSFLRDLDTGKEVEWHYYMRRVIDKLGIDNIRPYIPFSIDFLKGKLAEDEHFNNTKLAAWEWASGFISEVNRKTKALECKPVNGGIAHLFVANGITSFSSSDGVCVLKETARILCRR